MKEDAIEKRYKYYKKQELSKESKRFQIRFGVGANTIYNNTAIIDLDSISEKERKIHYSAGLYIRKRNKKKLTTLTGFNYNYGEISLNNNLYYNNYDKNSEKLKNKKNRFVKKYKDIMNKKLSINIEYIYNTINDDIR